MKYIAITIKFLIAVSILLVIFNKASGCELSWIRYADICYRIFETKLSDSDAFQRCRDEFGDLVTIPDVSILDFLSQHVSFSTQSKFWVGITMIWNQINWRSPDGFRPLKNETWVKMPESDEHRGYCFAFNGTIVAEEPCEDMHGFICERRFLNKIIRTQCFNASKYSFIGEVTGNCLFTDRKTTYKNKAAQKCLGYSAHFVDFDEILKDGLTAFYEYKYLSNDGSRYWTNLEWNGTNLIRNNFEVLPEDYPVSIVNNWLPDYESCITVQFDFTDILLPKFYKTDCNSEAYVICSRDNLNVLSAPGIKIIDGVCPDDPSWVNWQNFCYMETFRKKEQRSFDDAERYCQEVGGHLASFHSHAEEDVYYMHTDEELLYIDYYDSYATEEHNHWIGLFLDVDSGSYNWTDGTPLDFDYWAAGEPKHRDKLHRCVLMNSKDKYWRSAQCGIRNYFICKLLKIVPCYQGNYYRPLWHLDGPCYFVFEGTLRWNEAREYCEGRRAHLVSIHSAEEMGFLLSLIRQKYREYRMGSFWIGLNAQDNDGNLLWTDGTAVDFTYFPDYEAFDSSSQKKCGVMKNRMYGNWRYEDCNRSHSFICKTVYGRTLPTIAPTTIASTTIAPTTLDPTKIGDLGNSKSGWIPHRTIVIKNPESTETIVFEDPKSTEQQGFPTAGILGVIFSVLMIAALIVVGVFFRKRISELLQLRRKDTHSRMNIGNAKYDACSSSMTFNKENKN